MGRRDPLDTSAAPRLTSVVFRLTRHKLLALKALSRNTRVRQSEYLREAIEDVLQKYEIELGRDIIQHPEGRDLA